MNSGFTSEYKVLWYRDQNSRHCTSLQRYLAPAEICWHKHGLSNFQFHKWILLLAVQIHSSLRICLICSPLKNAYLHLPWLWLACFSLSMHPKGTIFQKLLQFCNLSSNTRILHQTLGLVFHQQFNWVSILGPIRVWHVCC